MTSRTSALFAQEQMRQIPQSSTLVVLHPDYHAQHSLFAQVLSQPDAAVVFVAVPRAGLPFRDLLGRIVTATEMQLGLTLSALPDQPAAAGRALAAALNSKGVVTLIFDAFDLADAAHSVPFVAALANALDAGSRVILSTRELPISLLEHGNLAGKVALIPVHPDRMILNYAEPSENPVLEVRALGPGRVLVNGRRIDHWDGVLPRTLFFYFIDRGMTTRDEIFQTFWPTLTTREATNVFHVTKRKISEILQTDLTIYWSGFYRVSPALNLQYDVIKFAEAVQNAAVAPDDEALELYGNAIGLYNGAFLSSITLPWVERRRVELVSSCAEALAGLARIYQRRNALLEALGYYLRAAATSPYREDLARAIMELYRDLGHPADALATFARLQTDLKATLGVTPDRQTVELAETIRKTS